MACNCDVSRRNMIKRLAAGGAGGLMVMVFPALASQKGKDDGKRPRWAYVVDTSKCIGCCACMRACRAENEVPEGNFRTWIERYRVMADGTVNVDAATTDNHVFQPAAGGETPVKAFFVPKLCNHCEKSVCSQVCPVGATYQSPEGPVLVDRKHCIGCGYCVQACPYGTRFIHKKLHFADKCTLCYHRITKGLLPACVQSCPKGARIFGDLNDPKSRISTVLRQQRYRVLKPEMGTHPRCYYLELDHEVV